MQIYIQAAEERDFQAIAGIQGSSEGSAQWPIGDYSNFLVLVARVDGKIAGFCVFHQVTSFEAELLNLAVMPAMRRKGVARALLQELRTMTTGTIYLEVAENNTPARQLYESSGWESVGMRPGYYEGGKINAVVMKKGSC